MFPNLGWRTGEAGTQARLGGETPARLSSLFLHLHSSTRLQASLEVLPSVLQKLILLPIQTVDDLEKIKVAWLLMKSLAWRNQHLPLSSFPMYAHCRLQRQPTRDRVEIFTLVS
jgi:hypothetical protein